MAERISSFRDLKVYQLAVSVQQEIFELSKQFPKEEKYSLTDQIRRSSRSVGANIAEAWHKRRCEAHFISKLTDADGEQAETQHWLEAAHRCGYLAVADFERFHPRCLEIGRMIGGMMAQSHKFCQARSES